MTQKYRIKKINGNMVLVADNCAYSRIGVDGQHTIFYPAINAGVKVWVKEIAKTSMKEVLLFDDGIKEIVDMGRLENAHPLSAQWYPLSYFVMPGDEADDWESPNDYISEWSSTLTGLDENKYFIHPYNYHRSEKDNLYPAIINGELGWFVGGKFLIFDEGVTWLRNNGYWESLF